MTQTNEFSRSFLLPETRHGTESGWMMVCINGNVHIGFRLHLSGSHFDLDGISCLTILSHDIRSFDLSIVSTTASGQRIYELREFINVDLIRQLF